MLLLLRHGGRTVYFGPAGSSLIDYLESVPGVRPIKPGVNPANWMLECIGRQAQPASCELCVLADPLTLFDTTHLRLSVLPGAGINPASESVDFADWYAHSDLCLRNRQDLDRLLESPSGLPCDRMLRGRFAAPMLVQLRACCRKAALNYWRSPNYNFSRMLISVLVAVVFGSVFHHKVPPLQSLTHRSLQDIDSRAYPLPARSRTTRSRRCWAGWASSTSPPPSSASSTWSVVGTKTAEHCSVPDFSLSCSLNV